MEKVYRFQSLSPSFGSRVLGKKIRKEIIDELPKCESLVLDLEGVRVVSHGFADECFGKLAIAIGDTYEKKIKLRNMRPFVEAVIKMAVAYRKEIEKNSQKSLTK